MAALDGYYAPPHLCQYDYSANTSSNGCTWTVGAMGANAATGGKTNRNPDQIHALVPRWQETDPSTPGWSIPDLDRAMGKLGVGFTDKSQSNWPAVLDDLDSGHYVVLQGMSYIFANSTCSGAFNGSHCIGIHPAVESTPQGRIRWIDDPICHIGRWEYEVIIRHYGAALDPSMRFGTFNAQVPKSGAHPPAPSPTPSPEGYMIFPQQLMHVVTTGDPTYIYSGPDHKFRIPSTLPKGKVLAKYGGFTGWQFVLITYGVPGIPQYAWLTSDQVKFDPTPLTCSNT